jgi:hypothetical protein
MEIELQKVEEGLSIQNLQYRMKISNIKGRIISEIGKGAKLVMTYRRL